MSTLELYAELEDLCHRATVLDMPIASRLAGVDLTRRTGSPIAEESPSDVAFEYEVSRSFAPDLS